MSLKLLKDLNFAGKLSVNEAVTDSGKEFLKSYRGYLYSNPASCGLVNGFIQEASKFTFDSGLASILESVVNFVNENNISWKLASACESITSNPSSYNYISRVGVEQVEKLLEMNESEVIGYIKAGALKGVMFIPEFRSITKEVYNSTINEELVGNTYSVKSPVSYILNENGVQTFAVLGKTFSIEDNKVTESTSDNKTFNRINLLLESFTKEDDDLVYTHNASGVNPYSFRLNENGLTFAKNNINEHFDTPNSFMEFVDTLSKTMSIREKMEFMNVCGAVSEVFENMDQIVLVDCAKVVTCSNGTVCTLVEANDNVNLTVNRSYNAGTSSNNYEFVTEALQQVTKLTGVDLSFMFEKRIDEDCKKKNPEEYKQIQEELKASKNAQIDIRKKKIAMLAEKYKNDPARIALLNRTAQELALLENMN